MVPEDPDALQALFGAMTEGVALHEVVRGGDGRISDYRVLRVNPAFERQTGLRAAEVVGRLASECYGAGAPPYLEQYTRAVEGEAVRFESEFEPLGRIFRISAFRISPEQFGTVFEDISEDRRTAAAQRLNEARLAALYELASMQTSDEAELVRFALESAVRLTGSEVGYLHFLDADQENLTLFAWNDRALDKCTAVTDRHYPLSAAGIWADCVRQRKPIVHNDYPNAEGRKGLPEGHFPLLRHMSACVVDDDRVTVVAGVGNKATDYDPDDVRQLELFLHGTWDMISQLRRGQEAARREERAQASQKLEAIGRLSGGIAHDFNNLLSVILTYSKLALAELPADDPLRADLAEIQRAGERAAALTSQLLAFGRRQMLRPEVVNVNDVILNAVSLLQRLLGEDIEIRTHLAPDIDSIEIDPARLEQVVMNLALNARDAMPNGGKLTIETENVTLGDAYAANHLGVAPGPHVALIVADDGCGMDADTRSRVFEPFFTTKPTGKGTGLGLSTVFGIVKQSGGSIYVYSELDQGTTFKLYFPTSSLPARERPPRADSRVVGGREKVLIVEDDAGVRTVAKRILQEAGYSVVVAANGPEALARVAGGDAGVDLVLSDVVMPGMSGRDLADALRARGVRAKVLFMSGYTENAIVHHGVLDSTVSFVSKPLAPDELLRAVRATLDREG